MEPSERDPAPERRRPDPGGDGRDAGHGHQFITVRNPRKRDGKSLHYLTDGATSFLYPLSRITFIEMMGGDEEAAESNNSDRLLPRGRAAEASLRTQSTKGHEGARRAGTHASVTTGGFRRRREGSLQFPRSRPFVAGGFPMLP